MPKKRTTQPDTPLLSLDRAAPESVLNSASQTEPFAQVPAKIHKSITVVCACVLRQGGQQVLLSMRRAPGVSGLDGKWELPGGKIEFGETPEQTIVREIREELGIS